MHRTECGGSLTKYLLLIFFVALFVAFFIWKNNYGRLGTVKPLPGTTADDIAFINQGAKGDTNLYLIRADGTDLRPLTDDPAPKRSPSWSPDGKQICFSQEVKEKDTTTNQLYLLGGGGSPVQLTYGSTAKDMPQWSSDGHQIAFLVGGVIKVVQPNGNNLSQIYPPPQKGVSADDTGQDISDALKVPPINLFRWSPIGGSVAAVQVAEGETAPSAGSTGWWLRSSNSSASQDANPQHTAEPESVIVLPGLDAKPFLLIDSDANLVGISWFPDGKRVAVAMRTGRGFNDLRVYRADVKDMLPSLIYKASGMTAAPQNPDVSPDGSKVAFEVWRTGSSADSELLGIAVLPTDSSSPMIIRNAADIAKIPLVIKGRAANPQWSPDGTRLLYSMPTATGTRDLWVASANGSNAQNITKGRGDCYDAVWSPAH